MRLVPSLALSLAAVAVGSLAPPAAAAPARCTAIASRSCTYQSSSGYGDYVCLGDTCALYIDGAYERSARYGETFTFWTSYGDVVLVVVYDFGAAHAGTSPFPRP